MVAPLIAAKAYAAVQSAAGSGIAGIGAQPSGPDFARLTTADGSIVVELQVAKTAFQLLVVSRARAAKSGASVATPEDLLVLKLIAHRAKDRIDLEGLARIPSIDS